MDTHTFRPGMQYVILLLVLLASCAAPAPPQKFPFFRQTLNYDCAPSCLKMIYAYYGEDYPEAELMRRLKTDTNGTTLKAMHDLSNQLGFTTMMISVNIDFLTEGIKLPCIVDWNGNHVVVVYKVDATHIYVADPADTFHVYDKQTFMRNWLESDGEDRGIALVVYKL